MKTSFIYILKIFIWLHQVLVVACEIKFPEQVLNPSPLH